MPRNDSARNGMAAGNAPLPPQNLEAEEFVLGAMMLSANAIEAVSEIIDAGDFYRESHAKIYRVALELFQHGHPVDAITVADKLDETGELAEIGGPSGSARSRRSCRPPPMPATTRGSCARWRRCVA